MSVSPERPIEYRPLKAPRRQGERLIVPALAQAPRLVEACRAELSTVQQEIGGVPLAELRTAARAHLLKAARSYTGRYRTLPAAEPNPGDALLLGGHQPELYHPGVWYKNVVLAQLGKRLQAAAVNLIIDADTMSAPSLRVLAGTPAEPRMEIVAFDVPGEPIPFEERSVLDSQRFASFAERVQAATSGMLPANMLLHELWPQAVEAARNGYRLGEALAQARHQVEARWGLHTLEVPLSHVCRGEPFRLLLLHVLANLPEFVRVYNTALHEYRRVHKLRSRSHPAPDLQQQGDWLEAPFWIWSGEQPRRARLVVRGGASQLELKPLEGNLPPLRLPKNGHWKSALHTLEVAEQQGLKLRPRALLTTLFARLLMGDLFIHGIGGAKYDQLTDALIRRFFGLEPPGYLTVTATAYPPLEVPPVEPADLTRLCVELRNLEYHAERYVDLGRYPAARAYVEQKQRALAAEQGSLTPHERHAQITSANEALQPYLAEQRDAAVRQYGIVEREVRIRRLIRRREWSFSLFREDFLRRLLLDQTVNTA